MEEPVRPQRPRPGAVPAHGDSVDHRPVVDAPRPGPLGTPARLAAAVVTAVSTLVVLPDLAVSMGWWGDGSSTQVLSSTAGSLLSIASGLVLARTGWTRSSASVPGSRRLGRALVVVGGAAALLGIATLALVASGEAPVGPLADGSTSPAQTLAMVALAVGAAALPTSRRWDATGVIDALLVVLAGLTLMWVAPLRGEVEPSGGLVQVLRADPSMAVTVAVILIAAVLLVRVDPDAERALRPVVIALLLYPAAFYTAAVAGLGGGNEAGVLTTELWWVTAPVLLLAVGLRVAPLRAKDRSEHTGSGTTLTSRLQAALPGVAVVVILAGVATHQRFMDRLNPVTMGIGVVTVLLAVLRLVILQREQRELLGRLGENAVRLADQARLDRLTGLGNRTALGEYLARLLADPPSTGVSVFFIDLDNFKGINDSLGHDTGDRLLGELAVRLTDVLGPDVYRIGGDEFIGVRADLDTERAEAMAAALVAALRPPMAVDGRPVTAAASVGLARSTVRRGPDRGERDTADALLRRADLALYRAKELGRGRWAAYDPWLQDRADRRLELQQGLRTAVEARRLEVVFEPVVALPARRVVGAATQLRWETAGRGVLDHAEIMSVAEEAGLRHRLLDAVLDEIGPRLADMASHGDPCTVSVAVGADDVARPELVERLAALVGTTGGSPGRLQVEVPEQAVADDRTAEALDGLVALGVGLVVTGFGNGPSSLRRLARYPASAIEVDRSFISGIGLRRDDRLILEAVGRLAAELGLELVADGVTTEVQASELETLGAARASGPLFGSPVPWDEFRSVRPSGPRPVGPAPGPGR
jgi:diguanylate cyclase (GGDEF)-like protein